MKSEAYSDNELQVKDDIEKLKSKGIISPPTPKKNELRIGNCTFYPTTKRRREEILKRYGLNAEDELRIYNNNYGKN